MLTNERRAELLAKYREGPRLIEAAVKALGPDRLDAAQAGQEADQVAWTAREVVHHVADSEMTSAVRLRRLIAEDAPRIDGYDQEQFARRLHYSDRPIEGSLAAISAARESTASLLDCLSAQEWEREGTHSEMGAYSVDHWLEIYAEHCHAHAEQISRAAQQP